MHKQLQRFFTIIIVLLNTVLYSQHKKTAVFIDSIQPLIYSNPTYVIKAMDSLKKNNKTTNESEFYKIRGQAYFTLNDFSNTYNDYNKGLFYAKKEGALETEFDFYSLLSELFMTIPNKQKALKHLKLAEEIAVETNKQELLIDVKSQFVYFYIDDKEYQKAIDILLTIKENKLLLTMPNEKIYNAIILVETYLMLGDTINASKHIIEFKNLKKEYYTSTNDELLKEIYTYHVGSIYDLKLRYFLDNNQTDSSLHYLSKLKNHAYLNDNYNKKEYYTNYAKIYLQLDNKKLYGLYQDSINQLEQLFNTNLIKNNVLQNDTIKVVEERLTKSNLKRKWILAIAFLVLLIAFVLFIRYKKNAIKNLKLKEIKISNLKDEVKQQEKVTVQLRGKENFLHEIKHELKVINRLHNDDSKNAEMQSLFKKVHLETNTNEFKGSYEEVYSIAPTFFNVLKNTYPQLSKSEQIICYYLSIEFKNAEIAFLLNTSIRSVEGKRYRISKKMNDLTKSTSLVDILKKMNKNS